MTARKDRQTVKACQLSHSQVFIKPETHKLASAVSVASYGIRVRRLSLASVR